MSDIAITCEGLSKQYRIGERESYKALRDVITDAASAPFRRLRSAVRDANGSGSSIRNPKSEIRNSFWALDDVSFEVKRGEVVGIIGRNGAGKSTLLKILSRITKPTRGHARIHGRVGSLLEVGTGFHPELTGRENIYLNAAILGMRKAEVAKKFDEIVAFAEVEKFIDTPVKRYSSGMYVRLAFAVAAHLETEVLIIDEVLAVGDAAFQKKCLGKMKDVSTREGRTLLFVSHNMDVLEAICSQAYLLDQGVVIQSGKALDVTQFYRGMGSTGGEIYHVVTGDLRWRGIGNRSLMDNLAPNDDLDFVFEFETGHRDISDLHLDCAVVNEKDEIIIHSMSRFVSNGFKVAKQTRARIDYRIKSPKLVPGHYYVTLYAYSGSEVLFWADRIDACHVVGTGYFGHLEFFTGLRSPIIPEFTIDIRSSETREQEPLA